MIIKYIYSIFLGVLVATFIGVGIAAFYPEPKFDYEKYNPHTTTVVPVEDGSAKPVVLDEAVIQKEQREYDTAWKTFEKTRAAYNRNVSIIALVFAILVVSLTFFNKILVIADGLMVGGLLTLLYSIVRGFSVEDNMFRFFVVSAGLLIALVLGYLKFIKTTK